MGFVVGFIVAGAIQEMLEGKKRSWSKRIAADCRSISAALESYRGDHGSYPPLDGKIEHLTPYLTPTYLRQLPIRNMSGQPYLVVLNGGRRSFQWVATERPLKRGISLLAAFGIG